jgi:hypothetical protein
VATQKRLNPKHKIAELSATIEQLQFKERAATRQPVVLVASNSDLVPSDPDDAVLS